MREKVKRREIFYISGYDPRGARYYYNLYKKESALQSNINGLTLNISSRKRTSPYSQSWKIKSTEKGHSVKNNYHFLEWDDIIRERWSKNIFSYYFDLFLAIKKYIFTGLIFKYGKTSPIQMIAAFYPVTYLFATLYVVYLFWNFSYEILNSYISFSVLAMTFSALLSYYLMKVIIKFGNKLAVFWLLSIYVFATDFVSENLQTLEKRIDLFSQSIADTIENVKENDIDEILIVAHSVGTILLIPTLRKALQKSNISFENISIMTLGECIPIVSFQPDAHLYRKDMSVLIKNRHIFWLDYTTKIDGACFPLLDFYTHSGVDIDQEDKIQFLSPRFHTLFSEQRYKELRKNRYLTHFIYLLSTEFPGRYDFFKMTSGSSYLSAYSQIKNEERQ